MRAETAKVIQEDSKTGRRLPCLRSFCSLLFHKIKIDSRKNAYYDKLELLLLFYHNVDRMETAWKYLN